MSACSDDGTVSRDHGEVYRRTDGHYWTVRCELARAVRAETARRRCRLIGSWLHDEFHLDRVDYKSQSDIDAVGATGGAHREAEVLAQLPGGIRLTFRLSVQPRSYIELVSPTGLALFAVLNVSGTAIKSSFDSYATAYEVNKAYLTLIRGPTPSPYGEVAKQLGEVGRYSFGVKLGLIDPTVSSALQERVADALGTELRSALPFDVPLSSDMCAPDLLRGSLDALRRSDALMPTWLRDYAVRKYSKQLD